MSAQIAAVVLAAGLSRRMGQSKMTLPWGGHTVIEQVVSVLSENGVAPIVVVTGGHREKVEQALQKSIVQLTYNPAYQTGEMLSSLQKGLASLPASSAAALITLGDQPHIQAEVVTALLRRYEENSKSLIVPSYQMRRGHPWLVRRSLWGELLELPTSTTLRNFLQSHANEIDYIDVKTASVLKDIDTPQDYEADLPEMNN